MCVCVFLLRAYVNSVIDAVVAAFALLWGIVNTSSGGITFLQIYSMQTFVCDSTPFKPDKLNKHSSVLEAHPDTAGTIGV